MIFEDKYRLSPREALFLAKKKWDENVYCGMKMENRNVTFPQTKTILDGVNVPGVLLDDIQAILNMRDAWRFMLNALDQPISLEFLCSLNEFITRNETLDWGKLRTGRIYISGTDYLPPIPDADTVREELSALLAADTTATEKALSAFAWGARGQFFWDGNKRTSLMLANRIMLDAGAGMLTISEKNMEGFNQCLSAFYNTGDADPLKAYLYENAIQGIEW